MFRWIVIKIYFNLFRKQCANLFASHNNNLLRGGTQIHGAKTINCKKPAVHVCRKAMSSKTMQNNFVFSVLQPSSCQDLHYNFSISSSFCKIVFDIARESA